MSVINSIPLIAAGDDGYQISRSVRLRSSASAYFNRTFGSGGSQTTWTLSLWYKRGALAQSSYPDIFSTNSASPNQNNFRWNADDTLVFYVQSSATTLAYLQTTQVFRDPSAWYHIVLTVDTTNATSTDRLRLYINGQRVTAFLATTYPSQNQTLPYYNGAVAHYLGASSGSVGFNDCYMTEVNFVNAQSLAASSFGETNSITGVWQPKKYAGTYGTNGFYLNFSDNSAATATTIGKDYSGNGNNWTPNNISVTAGVTYDSMIDSPTMYIDGGTNRGNYATPSPLNQGSYVTLSNGNLTVTGNTATNSALALASIGGLTSGKWYWEYTQGTVQSETCGITTTYTPGTSLINGENIGAFGIGARATGTVYGGAVGSITSWTTGDVIGIAVDCDNGAIYWSKNGTWLNSGVPTSGSSKTGAVGTWTPSSSINVTPAFGAYNGGFVNVTFGQRPFTYTPPTGFKALNTQNLPDATIKNGAAYMAATLYTGTGSALTVSNAVNGVSFQPDFVWVKGRSGATSHNLSDSVRGTASTLFSNTTGAENASTQRINAFNSNGFSVGNDTDVSTNTATYVGWQWKANGSGVTNTAGSITSTVSANTTSGLSIVTYTGTGANATVGHGLGVAPSLIIAKARGTPNGIARPWYVYHIFLGAGKFLYLNQTDAAVTGNTVWQGVTPTSSVFSLGNEPSVNYSSSTYVAYCFAEVAGYSKFGSYTGNGSSDGPFVFTNFRPRFVLAKASSGAENWVVLDAATGAYNVISNTLLPNTSGAEVTGTARVDFLSNGFKLKATGGASPNGSGVTYVYAAFAENPFKYSLAR